MKLLASYSAQSVNEQIKMTVPASQRNGLRKGLIFFLLLALSVISTYASAATNQLGWSSAQASRWATMRSQNHPFWQRLKSKADDPGVYADNGMRDGMVYLITGNKAYAQSAYGHISHYAGRNSSGSQPNRNGTRHAFGEMALMYSWVADALPAADKAHYRDILEHWSDLVFSPAHGTRTVDSDELTGHYFGITLFALAIRSEDLARSNALLNMNPSAWAPVGGLDATGINRSTWRNTLAEYVKISAGGAWMEGSQYNTSTVRYLVEYSRMINAFFGQDKFPEITALIPGIEQTLLQEMTPNRRDSFQWGDIQDAHQLTTYHRVSLLALISDLTKNSNMYDLFDTVFGIWPSSSSLTPHFYLFLDPYASRSKINGQTSHNASGMGLAYHHTGWTNSDSFFSSWHQTITKVDHETVAGGNFSLYRKGEWTLGTPVTYSASSGFNNTLLMSGGLDSAKETRGQTAYESGQDFLYHVGSTGGQTYRAGYYDPAPELIHEWTRSNLYLHNADGSDTVIVFDRINGSNPLTDLTPHQLSRMPAAPGNPTRVHIGDITATGGKHQWIVHLDDPSPQINGNTITWYSNKGEKIYLESFLSSNYTTAVYDEKNLRNGGQPALFGFFNSSELSYQLRLIPNQTRGWQTMLNVLHVGSPLNATRYLASAGEQARGVLVDNNTDSNLVIFNGDPGALPYTANGNPVAIAPTPNNNSRAFHDPNRAAKQAQLRFFNSGFNLAFNANAPTRVYIADLDPTLVWFVSVNGSQQTLTVSSAGLATFSVPASGSYSLQVYTNNSPTPAPAPAPAPTPAPAPAPTPAPAPASNRTEASAPYPGRLSPSVKGIVNVTPAPGSTVPAEKLILKIKYTAPIHFKWTHERFLILRDITLKKVIYKIDLKPGDRREGNIKIWISTGIKLKPGHRYSVTVQRAFVRLNKSPWIVKAVPPRSWTFIARSTAPSLALK